MYVWDIVNPQHSHLGALPTVGAVPKEEKRGALISRVVNKVTSTIIWRYFVCMYVRIRVLS